MSLYQPETKIYYGPLDSDHRLIPAPNISISLEYQYAGNNSENIIGYSYIITLNGLATALDLRNLAYNGEIVNPQEYNSGAVIDHINKLRNILTQNGNILHVVNGQDNSHILRAKGGILRSFSLDNSTNNWKHNAAYTATLEFHSIDLMSSTENCSNIFLDPNTFNDNGILDINKFKIKSFEDSWSFNFEDSTAFANIPSLNINNHTFNIEYSINAVGKHFFVYSNETTGDSTLLPAWEQAKNFVQYRLYNQVTSLISNILKDNYENACSSSDGLNSILEPGTGAGLLVGVGDNRYQVFNEQITCEASESDGSFSAKYSAIIKNKIGDSRWSSSNTKHTITKNITTNNDTGNSITNISLNGTIEGLVEGGLINNGGPINLPQAGSLLISNNTSNSKYNNAKNVLDQIYNENDYNSGLGECGKRDLKTAFKDALDINLTSLNMTYDADGCSDPPHPINFNLTHDYNNGIINYTVEYSNKKNCGRKFNEISIQTSNPNKTFVTFNVPNSNNCPVIQELGTYSTKTVLLTVRGIDASDIGQPMNFDPVEEILSNLSLGCYSPGYLPITLPQGGNNIITQKQYTKNPLDGSFTVVVGYICGTEGCIA